MPNQNEPFDADREQLKALAHVINQITDNKVPLVDPARPSDMFMPKTTDFVTNKNIRNLQNWCSEYVFDDGDLVQDLKSAIIEFQYLLAVIKDLREQVKHLQSENARLERLAANAI